MSITSLADAKAHLSEIIASTVATHERTVITKNGRPAAVIMSVDDLEALEETLYWASLPRLTEQDEEIVTDDELRATLTARGIPLPDALRA